MSGQGRSGQKPSQRLGSLAADKETEKAGRLGVLTIVLRSSTMHLSKLYMLLIMQNREWPVRRCRCAAHEYSRQRCWRHWLDQWRFGQRDSEGCKGMP